LQWAKIFKIPAPLLVLGDGSKKAFDYTIKTDGVGASVTCCKWVSKSLHVKGEACERAYGDIPSDAVYVGIDPGVKSIVATAREGNARSGYSLSNKQYYHECKMNERKLLKEKHLREAGLTDWLTATPSPKTSRSTRMVEHLAYLLGSPLYTKAMDIHQLRREKHMRWKVDIHKKKTLDAVCKKIIGDTPKDKLVVAFGDASWTTNLRGSRAAPRRKWVAERLRRVHGVRVVDVNEYNTSRVCSACGEKNLEGAGSKEDKMGRLSIRVVNPCHVRRCQSTSCRTVWNR
jgi:transposase